MNPAMNFDRSDAKEVKIAVICSALHAACDVSMWCYGVSGELYFTTSNCKTELDAFFTAGGCKEWALSQKDRLETPLIMRDPLGFLWAGEFIEGVENLGRLLVLIGPTFPSENSMNSIEQRIREMNLALSLRGAASRVLNHVPVVPIAIMKRYTSMLHFVISDKVIPSGEFIYQSYIHRDDPLDAAGSLPASRHYLDYESEFTREQMLLQCVKDGNPNDYALMREAGAHSLSNLYAIGDPLLEAKYTVVIFAAKCAGAAIEGGLSPKLARQLETQTVGQAERCRTITELSELNQRTYETFVDMVHKLRNQGQISKPVQAVCDYIKTHFMEQIRLEDLAKAACYSEYYLTRKFQKEMGQRISDYIRDTRLEYAKIWLISTEKSIQEISELLQFCSRNYFSRVFKEKEGISPQEYRERSGVLRRE